MDYKRYIAERLKIEGMSAEEIAEAIAVPPDTQMGDYALPCFKMAKLLRKSPVQIAEGLAAEFPAGGAIAEASALNGYLNFKIDRKGLSDDTLFRIKREGNY